MATFIPAGTSRTIAVPAGQVLYMSGNGTAQVVPYSGGAQIFRPLHVITLAGGSICASGNDRSVLLVADPSGSGINARVSDPTASAATISASQAAAGGFVTPQPMYAAVAKLMAASGGAATGNHTFSEQKQALGAAVGFRAYYANFDTAASLTITLAKACWIDTDLANGSAGTYATLASALVVPQATGGANPQIIPGIAATPWVMLSSIARVDAPTANPLLLVTSYIAGACTVGNVGTAAPLEIAASHGYLEGAGVATGDFVTNPLVAHAMTRNGNLFHPCAAVEFLYNQPAITVASVGDSLVRGQTDGAGAVGFRSLDLRACSVKNAQNNGTIYSPMTFALSGQQHTPSYSVALAIAQQIKPRYLIMRGYTVNDAATQAAFDNDYGELGVMIETCIQNGVTPILLTTCGTDALSAGAVALLAASNAKILLLKAKGAIVIDAAGALCDSGLKLLPAYYGADATHVHCNDAAYDVVAGLIADAIA